MCRASTEPNGPWRCIPKQGLLNAARGSHKDKDFSEGLGYFWAPSSSYIPSLSDITWHQKRVTAQLTKGHVVLDDVVHLGRMISSYSDSRIEDFGGRLADAQTAGKEYSSFYNTEKDSEKLARKFKNAVDLSLGLSSDISMELLSSLQKIRSFKGENPIRDDINAYTMNPLDAGQFFPFQWKDAISRTPVNLIGSVDVGDFDSPDYAGYFNYRTNSIVVSDNYMSGFGRSMHSGHDDMVAAESKAFQEHQAAHLVLVHEFGHKYESVSPQMLKLSLQFLRKRVVRDKAGKPLGRIDGNIRKVADHFPDDYTGTIYSPRAEKYKPYTTEVVSVGMESLFLGSNGSFVGLPTPFPAKGSKLMSFHRADPEYRDLMLGLLSAVEVEKQTPLGYAVKSRHHPTY